MEKRIVKMDAVDGKQFGSHCEKVIFRAYDEIHGTKFLNGSRTDNKVARAEAERMFAARLGSPQDSINFVWEV